MTPPADAALATCLMPAMRFGGRLTMSDPVSPRVLRGQREFGAVQAAWSRRWTFGPPGLAQVEVAAPTREPAGRPPSGRVAAFFSGGVDSFATVLENPELTDLIFIRGVDLLPAHAGHVAIADEVVRRVRAAAAELELELHVVETNVRELSDGVVPWEAYFACPLIAVAHMFESLFDRVLIAGDVDYELQELLPYGALWTVDQLWSSETVEIVDWGGRLSRAQRERLATASPVAWETLRVCWQNFDGAYNCGRCSKCLRAIVTFEALGASDRMRTFPPLQVGRLEELDIPQLLQMLNWEDTLQTIRAAGRSDLAPAIEDLLERGRHQLGLPADFRTRVLDPRSSRAPTPPPPGPTLFAEPATAAALAAAPEAAILIGSYDGSGNFGDIAQLEGALAALAPLRRRLLTLPVIELGAAERHRDPSITPRGVDRVLVFDPSGTGAPGLVPVAAPSHLALGVVFLYGGGYLNPAWGERKLAMLAAAEQLLAGARGGPCRLASGLQVDAEWLATLPVHQRESLRRFELLGGRDPSSTAALAELGGSSVVVDTGDDAVGTLTRLRPGNDPAAEGPLLLNLHFSDHAWVTDDPDRMLGFTAALPAALAAHQGRPVQVRPLLAYADSVTDERRGLERFGERCAVRGVELLEPRLLRAAELAALAPELRRASLTLSCSYHAALTSLLLGVPAVLLADLPYYEQKSAGLRAGFELPDELGACSREDPDAVASRLAAAALDPPAAERLQAALAAGRERAYARRAAAEAALLGQLATAGLGRLADSDRALSTLRESRSWRLTKPLRRGAARLRARRGG